VNKGREAKVVTAITRRMTLAGPAAEKIRRSANPMLGPVRAESIETRGSMTVVTGENQAAGASTPAMARSPSDRERWRCQHSPETSIEKAAEAKKQTKTAALVTAETGRLKTGVVAGIEVRRNKASTAEKRKIRAHEGNEARRSYKTEAKEQAGNIAEGAADTNRSGSTIGETQIKSDTGDLRGQIARK